MQKIQHPIFGEIDIGGTIGSGAYAEIYKAYLKDLHFPVCIKVSKDSCEKTINEYKVQSLCNDALCCQCLGHCEFKAQDAAILQYIEGTTLLNELRYSGPMDEKRAKVVFAELCHTIRYLHHNKIVHRDLKLENIMLDHGGNPHVIDFGFSRFLSKDQEANKEVCGSVNYLSPEIIQYGVTSFSNDVWALGVILYAMIFGRLPFDGPDNNTIIKCIMWKSIDIPIEISDQLRDLLEGMLQKHAEDRLNIDQVIEHSWLYDVVYGSGFHLLDNLTVFPNNKDEFDPEVIKQLENFKIDKEVLYSDVLNRRETKNTTLYFVLRMQLLTQRLYNAKNQMTADSAPDQKLGRIGVSLPAISKTKLSPNSKLGKTEDIKKNIMTQIVVPRTQHIRFRIKANSVAPDRLSAMVRHLPVTLLPHSPQI